MPSRLPAEVRDKLEPIQLVVLDVDGVLTDGTLIYSVDGEDRKRFSVRDGLAIRLLLRAGIQVGIISGRSSGAVIARCSELGIRSELIVVGSGDKPADLDRMEELEAAAGDKLDDAKIDELATKRAEGIVKTRVAPLERELKKLKADHEALQVSNTDLLGKANTRKREDTLRPLLTEAKVLPEHHEDVFLYAERHLEQTDDGKFIAREGVGGITAGATPKDWLMEMLDKRPGWLPGSQGGGARGSGPSGGFLGGPNPWSAENWNMTKQGEYLKAHGREKADAAAKSAGTSVGGQMPKARK